MPEGTLLFKNMHKQLVTQFAALAHERDAANTNRVSASAPVQSQRPSISFSLSRKRLRHTTAVAPSRVTCRITRRAIAKVGTLPCP